MQMHSPVSDDTVYSVHCEAATNWAVPRPPAELWRWRQPFVVTFLFIMASVLTGCLAQDDSLGRCCLDILKSLRVKDTRFLPN